MGARPDLDEVASALLVDRRWTAYMLADLDEPYARHARFWTGDRDGRKGVVLVYDHPEFCALVAHGDTGPVSAALEAADELPPCPLVIAREPGVRALAGYYQLDGLHDMLRMAVDPASFRPVEAAAARRLTASDLPRLRRLYAAYDGSVFTSDQLDHGVFFGVDDPHAPGRLVSAAGTHVVSRAHQIASVGNVFTLPESRGGGFAAQVTSAVTATLFEMGCRDVVLNVRPDNEPAVRVYRRLGYEVHCDFEEGPARRRA